MPAWVRDDLTRRLAADPDEPADSRLCQGTLLSKHQYRIDIDRWSYRDGRLVPNGRMTPRQAAALDRER